MRTSYDPWDVGWVRPGTGALLPASADPSGLDAQGSLGGDDTGRDRGPAEGEPPQHEPVGIHQFEGALRRGAEHHAAALAAVRDRPVAVTLGFEALKAIERADL